MDSGTTHLYIGPNAPHGPKDTIASRIRVGTANGQVTISTANATLPIPHLAADFPTTGYIMPTFTSTLIGIGPICDANCTLVIKKQDVTLISSKGKYFLQGWRRKETPTHMALRYETQRERGEQKYMKTKQKGPEARSVYELTSMEALVGYMHAAAIFPVKSSWLKVIKNGNFDSWPVLTYNNTAQYCPHSVETLKGHMVQSSQGVRSTKKNKYQKHNN